MKKPKLTAEEKKARKLARREEKRLKKIQRDIQAKKDELDRETRATDANAQRINDNWRAILRKVREPMLHDDFQTVRQRNERLMDMKNQMINELTDALDETNDQCNASLQCHVETIDKLLDLYAERMEVLSDGYRSALTAMGDALAEQKLDVREVQRHDEMVINMVTFGMEDQQAEHSLQRRAEFTVKIDEETVKHAEAHHTMQTRRETRLERQWEELMATLQEHKKRTAETRAAVAKLWSKECAEHRVIARQRARSRHLRRLIETMRSWDSAESENELRHLRAERGELRDAYQALRRGLDAERAHDSRQLGALVRLSHAAMQRLHCSAARGEKIVALAKLCRSLEDGGSEQDGAVVGAADAPAPDAEDHEEEAAGVAGAAGPCPEAEPCASLAACFGPLDEDLRSCHSDQAEEDHEDLLAEAAASLEGLQRFWARAGASQLAVLQARRHVAELRDQGEHLRLQLRHYLRAVAPPTCSPDPVPRGPPCVPVYEPAVKLPGTTPWRGVRGLPPLRAAGL